MPGTYEITKIYQQPPMPLPLDMINDVQSLNYNFLILTKKILNLHPELTSLFGFNRNELTALKALSDEDLSMIASVTKIIFEPDISQFANRKFQSQLPNEYFMLVGNYSNLLRSLFSQFEHLTKMYVTRNEDVIHTVQNMNQRKLNQYLAEHQFKVRHSGTRYWVNLFNGAIAKNKNGVRLRLSSFNNLE